MAGDGGSTECKARAGADASRAFLQATCLPDFLREGTKAQRHDVKGNWCCRFAARSSTDLAQLLVYDMFRFGSLNVDRFGMDPSAA